MHGTLIFAAAILLGAGARAQSLNFVSANYPGIYCHFSPNCEVSPVEQSDSFMPTNAAATCVLLSRTFAGTSVNAQGQFGYEYQLTINNQSSSPNETNVVTVDSLTLNFGEPAFFAFGLHASNQVWVVTSGGPAGAAPGSADMTDQKVTFHFDPPLTLSTATDQTTNTCVFGMASAGAPKITLATLTGTAQDPVNGIVPFQAKVRAQTP